MRQTFHEFLDLRCCMKKILACLLLLSFVFFLFACQGNEEFACQGNEESQNPDNENSDVSQDGTQDENQDSDDSCKRHKFGNWEIVSYPTEEAWGLNKRRCVNCDKEEEIKIPYGRYSAGLVYVSNGDGTCSVERYGLCEDENIVIPPTNEIGEPVTNIREWAFYGCFDVKSITLPDSLVGIGPGAFYGCAKITSIKIPDGVAFIGNSAFYDCRLLSAVVMPKTIETIGYNAFDGCRRLGRVFYSGTKEDWAKVTIHTENDVLYRSGLLVYEYQEAK